MCQWVTTLHCFLARAFHRPWSRERLPRSLARLSVHALDALSMISPIPSYQSMADLTSLLFQSPPPSLQSISHTPGSVSSALPPANMKDVSTTTRHPRPTAYPKKRPSPHGVTKSHKSPLLPPARKAQLSPKSVMIQKRQREAQISALRKEGVLLEEEYRDDIRYYMHEMEVSISRSFFCFWKLVAETAGLLILAVYDTVHPVDRSATRDQVAHAPVSCRLPR